MKEEKQGINWLDLILIGLSLFVANIIEKAINLQNNVLSFLLFVVVAILLIIVTYFLKYLITRDE
ncbi:MAG: hypothetical protein II422_07420 [Prevotella sp.]|jgi:hypothetical protein|nr:hypothetical protein [Prevotella sp.]